MQISLHPDTSDSASFDVPIKLLSACHDRVQRQCATLRRLLPHLQQHGGDADARAAAQNIIRYFDTSAVHHHADEEADLFPALLAVANGAEVERIIDLTTELTLQHRHLEVLWYALRGALQKLVDDGETGRLTSELISRFVAAYEAHIEIEEHALFPWAQQHLNAPTLALIGKAMQRRRSIQKR